MGISFTPISGVITLLITSRGPPCKINIYDSIVQVCKPYKSQMVEHAAFPPCLGVSLLDSLRQPIGPPASVQEDWLQADQPNCLVKSVKHLSRNHHLILISVYSISNIQKKNMVLHNTTLEPQTTIFKWLFQQCSNGCFN